MTRLTFIPPQFVKVATAYRSDLTQYVVGGVQIVGSVGKVRAWKVNLPSLTDGGEITIPNDATAKDDSASFVILDDGGLLVTISETTPGGTGSTAQPDAQIVLNVFPRRTTEAELRQRIRNLEERMAAVAAGAAG